jgi:hypothetical protein
MKEILKSGTNNLKSLLVFIFITLASATYAQVQKAKVGDIIGCGFVFHVQDSARVQTILLCTFTDQAKSIKWHNGVYITTFATKDGVADIANADQIIKVQKNGLYAATAAQKVSSNAAANCFDTSGWYLPSKQELLLLDKNLTTAQKRTTLKLAKEGYWSSLEVKLPDGSDTAVVKAKKAWIVDFLNGRTFPANKANKYHVRAVKAIRRNF